MKWHIDVFVAILGEPEWLLLEGDQEGFSLADGGTAGGAGMA